jgi:hypothetical protein
MEGEIVKETTFGAEARKTPPPLILNIPRQCGLIFPIKVRFGKAVDFFMSRGEKSIEVFTSYDRNAFSYRH